MKCIGQSLLFIFLLFNVGFTSPTSLLDLFEQQDSSITRIEDKFYLDMSKLVFDTAGIFIESDQHEYHSLPTISYDEKGYFFPINQITNNTELIGHIIEAGSCPNGHPSGMNDGLCSFPDCPFNRWGK